MRALHLSLRGVRVSALMAGLVAVLVSPVIFAKPTHAEGLLPTVRCLVQTLLLTGCPQPTTPDTTPVVTQPQTQPQTGAPAPTSQPSGSSTSPSTSSRNTLQAPEGVTTTPEPAVLEVPQQLEVMPKPSTTQNTRTPQTFDYAAFFNTSSNYASPRVEGDGGFITPSKEGWRVAGMAWYWWITIIAAITGVISYIRRRYVRRVSLLSNPQ